MMSPHCISKPRSLLLSLFKSFSTEARLNPLNIQILGESLETKVFPRSNSSKNPTAKTAATSTVLELSRQHLSTHKVSWNRSLEQLKAARVLLPDISGDFVPELLAPSLDEHFWLMAEELCADHLQLAKSFATALASQSPDSLKFPTPPADLAERPGGWLMYRNGRWEDCAEGPQDEVVVLDVEICPLISPLPLLACVYGGTTHSWYIWISERFLKESKTDSNTLVGEDMSSSSPSCHVRDLIPLKGPRLVIGHNVSFDRARLKFEYQIEQPAMRFLDTLSMHCAVAGISTQQRGLWQQRKSILKHQNSEEADILEEHDSNMDFDSDVDSSPDDGPEGSVDESAGPQDLTGKWGARSSLNNLQDAVWLHCGRRLNKSVRDTILLRSKSLSQDVMPNVSEIVNYCAEDVKATAELFSVLLPKFLQKSPHPVTFAALLEMGGFVLPCRRKEWNSYRQTGEKLHAEATAEIQRELEALVEATVILDPQKALEDPWLRHLDWTVEPVKWTKARYLKDGVTFAKGGEPRPQGNPQFYHKPAWYRKLFKGGRLQVTPRSSIVPYLLKLRWRGHGVQLVSGQGWCYQEKEAGGAISSDRPGSAKAVKIPHPGGRDENVGNLLTKSFFGFYESGDLTTASDSPLIGRVLNVNSKFSFWTGYRERIKDQFLVSLDGEDDDLALILPTVTPMGTVTRRAVEKTWMTASNSKETLVGSELKTLIKAPSGWCFVGADVDSQELWIGSLLGDGQFGWSGSTALGWMTLQGAKSDASDLHSRTAQILGMNRDQAKIFNYGRIYGAGVKYAAQLLLKFNPRLGSEEAAQRAQALYHATKGRRISNRRDAFVVYSGGTESFMFNAMEAIARSPVTQTPVLGAEISEGLLAAHVDEEFLTSRVNWVVQSSGVDYLHLLLVACSFLFRKFNIPGRVAITIHDELRFLVRQDSKYRAALALQVANLWTRAAFVQAIGVQDLPLSVAFFSAVDFDTILRKEVNAPCITPSSPEAKPFGEALNIYQLLQKCNSLKMEDEGEGRQLSSRSHPPATSHKVPYQPRKNPNVARSDLNEEKRTFLLKKQISLDASESSSKHPASAASPTSPVSRPASTPNSRPETSSNSTENSAFLNRWSKLIKKSSKSD